jgi:hypothetical protein
VQASAACLPFRFSMPVNKSALIRYMALDRCLQRKYRPYTLEGLLREVNRCLEEAGYSQSDSVALRTLYADLKFMESDAGFAAPIVREKKNGRKFYFYDDPGFSAIGVYSSLHNESLELIAHSKGILPFEWIAERLQTAKHPLTKKRTIIRFTNNPFVAGQVWVKKLYDLILEQVAVKIKININDTVVKYDLHPWQIREHKGRWYLLGKVNNSSITPIILALADIHTIEPTYDIQYLNPIDSDWEELFEDCIGPIPHADKTPEHITLVANGKTDKLLQNEPLHHSQIRRRLSENHIEYQFKLIWDHELERQLLLYGPDIYVSKPELLKLRMKALSKEMYDNYTE